MMRAGGYQVKRLVQEKAQHLPMTRRSSRQKGQAILEYTLLTVFIVLIFTWAFGTIRRSVFNLWVCELYPRIASINGCTDVSKCWQEIQEAGGLALSQCQK